MPIDKSCFSKAKKFKSFKQSDHLSPASGAVSISMETGQATKLTPMSAGQCYAYCCQWVQKIKADKGYMVDSLDTLGGIDMQTSMSKRFATSGVSNALILDLGGSQVLKSNVISLQFPNADDAQRVLGSYKTAGANFVMINYSGAGAATGAWGHMICLKVDQSLTGGYLNMSYPCAFFDPNIGQGMYNNMADLGSDLATTINAYSSELGPVTLVDCTLITFSSGMN